MGINHRCLNLCVPQNFLERQNIAAVNHEMTGEGVAQRMNSLAIRNIRCDRFDDIANQWIIQRRKHQYHAPFLDLFKQAFRNRNGTVFAVLRF